MSIHDALRAVPRISSLIMACAIQLGALLAGFAVLPVAAQITSNDIRILTPASGTSVAMGPLPVSVVALGGSTVVAVIGDGGFELGQLNPMRGTFELKLNRPGTRRLYAIGIAASNVVIQSLPVEVTVLPPPGVERFLGPAEVVLRFQGDIQTMPVSAHFVGYSLSVDLGRSLEVEAVSTDPGVVSVRREGGALLLVGEGKGRASVIVSFRGFAVDVAVEVRGGSRGDLNSDGAVDATDLDILNAWLNRPIFSRSDARDLNRDGIVSALDARVLVTLCTRLRCAVSEE